MKSFVMSVIGAAVGFVLACPGSRLSEAAIAAERVRQAIAATPNPHSTAYAAMTVSLGVAEIGSTEISEGLIERADEALYAAKHAGRNRVHWHDGTRIAPATGRVE